MAAAAVASAAPFKGALVDVATMRRIGAGSVRMLGLPRSRTSSYDTITGTKLRDMILQPVAGDQWVEDDETMETAMLSLASDAAPNGVYSQRLSTGGCIAANDSILAIQGTAMMHCAAGAFGGAIFTGGASGQLSLQAPLRISASQAALDPARTMWYANASDTHARLARIMQAERDALEAEWAGVDAGATQAGNSSRDAVLPLEAAYNAMQARAWLRIDGIAQQIASSPLSLSSKSPADQFTAAVLQAGLLSASGEPGGESATALLAALGKGSGAAGGGAIAIIDGQTVSTSKCISLPPEDGNLLDSMPGRMLQDASNAVYGDAFDGLLSIDAGGAAQRLSLHVSRAVNSMQSQGMGLLGMERVPIASQVSRPGMYSADARSAQGASDALTLDMLTRLSGFASVGGSVPTTTGVSAARLISCFAQSFSHDQDFHDGGLWKPAYVSARAQLGSSKVSSFAGYALLSSPESVTARP